MRSPAEKKKLIEGLHKQIESSIKQFYQKHNVEQEIKDLDSKNIKSILSYVLIQANQPAFIAHLEIAHIFSISEVKSHKMYDMLSSACEDIENGLINKK